MSYAAENLRLHKQWREWLGRQRAREDRVGVFARDFLADLQELDVGIGPCGHTPDGLRTLSKVDRHLKHCRNAPDDVLNARDQAWREFSNTYL